jgi:hypothetical protein
MIIIFGSHLIETFCQYIVNNSLESSFKQKIFTNILAVVLFIPPSLFYVLYISKLLA